MQMQYIAIHAMGDNLTRSTEVSNSQPLEPWEIELNQWQNEGFGEEREVAANRIRDAYRFGRQQLDLSHCNKLTSLNLSSCNQLKYLDLGGCTQLKELDLSHCTQLISLYLRDSQRLRVLNLNGCVQFVLINPWCTDPSLSHQLTRYTSPTGLTRPLSKLKS